MSIMSTKEQVARQIWLLYFNRTLLERGIITEKEHNTNEGKNTEPGEIGHNSALYGNK